MTRGDRQALCALDFVMGWQGGVMPVFRDEGRTWWRDAGRGSSELVGYVERADGRWSRQVELGLPALHARGGIVGGTVLWARVEGQAQLKAARAFRPLPSIVLAEGSSSRRLLLWPLDAYARYVELEEANRRIAYALGAKQRPGVPDELRVPVPGTFLRVGRKRPCAVTVARLEPVFFSVGEVVGRLREPPDKDAWRERVA